MSEIFDIKLSVEERNSVLFKKKTCPVFTLANILLKISQHVNFLVESFNFNLVKCWKSGFGHRYILSLH